jgi:hypothetical protein
VKTASFPQGRLAGYNIGSCDSNGVIREAPGYQKAKTVKIKTSLRKNLERLLSSGKYLVRGDRQGRISLGEAGGTWATNDLDNALIYGDEIWVVQKPWRIHKLEIDDAFAKCVDQNFGKEYGFDDATPEEWQKLREGLLRDGYEALDIIAPAYMPRKLALTNIDEEGFQIMGRVI